MSLLHPNKFNISGINFISLLFFLLAYHPTFFPFAILGGIGAYLAGLFWDNILQPRNANDGETGQEKWIWLRLKLIADIGLIGLPNAGKSTLIKTLVGVYSPDEGEIFIRNKKVDSWTALKARESGIETVFQDRALCPQQSIVWNIFMGKELKYPFGLIKEKKQIADIKWTNSTKMVDVLMSRAINRLT